MKRNLVGPRPFTIVHAGGIALGAFGVLASVTGFAGMLRNVVDVVGPAADLNNYLLPLWMIAFGIGLLRWRER